MKVFNCNNVDTISRMPGKHKQKLNRCQMRPIDAGIKDASTDSQGEDFQLVDNRPPRLCWVLGDYHGFYWWSYYDCSRPLGRTVFD